MSVPPQIGLTLVLGPANSGKMGHVLDWWQRRSAARPVLVTPTGPDAGALSAEMARVTGGVVGQSPAQTFDGLVELILGRSPRYASDFEFSLILSRLLREPRTEALGGAVHLPGTATALAALLRELGESGRTPEELDRILAQWASADLAARPLADDIRRLLDGYAETCARLGLLTRPDAVREAIGAADGWTRPVALYGFTSFGQGQRALIEELARRAEVLVTFNHDGSRPVDLTTPAEISWWRNRSVEFVELTRRTLAYSSPAVAYLERHFMGDGPRTEPPPGSSGPEGVHLMLASGQRAEAELAAERIVALLRSGLEPGDVAVVVRRVQKWSRLLAHVFDSCGLAYQMDDRCILGETGLGHAFLSALRGAVSDEAADVLAYLRSPYSGVSAEEAADLELHYRRGAVKGAAALVTVAENRGSVCLEGLWKAVGLSSAETREDPESTAAGFDPEAAEDLARRMLAAGLRGSTVGGPEPEEDARAFRAVRNAMTAMRSLAGRVDPELTLKALAQVSVPGGRTEAADAVQILSVERARARRFKAVVILGLVEGEFPGRPDTPSVLTPSQKERFDEVGGGLFAPEVDGETALFMNAVSRALQMVVLSARDAEDDGSEAAPSGLWAEAKKVLGLDDGDCGRRTLADQVFAPGAAPSVRHYLRAEVALGRAPGAGVEGAGPFSVPPWDRIPDRLAMPEVLDDLAAVDHYSPSALEAYVGCPFSWFVQRVIGVEEVDLELDSRTVGQLAHSALSLTYPKLASSGLLPLRADNIAEAESLAFSCVDDLVESGRCPGTPAERRLAAWQVKRMIRNLFGMETASASSLTFCETEMWVGGQRGTDIGGLRISGRIDRVDVTPDGRGLFVLDYKSGGIPRCSALGGEGGLQLPLYLMALGVEQPAMDVIGGAYLSLREKARSGVVAAESAEVLGAGVKGIRPRDEEGMEQLFSKTRETALAAIAGMRSGVIAPRSDGPCPDWCDLGPACGAHRGGYRS